MRFSWDFLQNMLENDDSNLQTNPNNKLNFCDKSICYQGVKTGNNIPNYVKSSKNVNSFKASYKQFLLMLNVLWSLGLDRPLAYFLVLLHNVFAEMYDIFMCFAVCCIWGRK